MNEIPASFAGNLTADPELHYTPAGKPVVSLRVAVNSRYRDQSGQWVDGETSYFDVEYWTGAQFIAESLKKGNRVMVTGEFRTRSWRTEDGARRSKLYVVASEVGRSLRYADVTKHADEGAESQLV